MKADYTSDMARHPVNKKIESDFEKSIKSLKKEGGV